MPDAVWSRNKSADIERERKMGSHFPEVDPASSCAPPRKNRLEGPQQWLSTFPVGKFLRLIWSWLDGQSRQKPNRKGHTFWKLYTFRTELLRLRRKNKAP